MNISPNSSNSGINVVPEQPALRTPSSNYPSANTSGLRSSQRSSEDQVQAVGYAETLAGASPTQVYAIMQRASAHFDPRDVALDRIQRGAGVPRGNRNWKVYAIGAGIVVGLGLALGLGLGLGLRRAHAGAAAVSTGANGGTPTVTVAPQSPLSTPTASATPTTSGTAIPTPTLAHLQDPSFEPEPAHGDLGQQVGGWQGWDVSLFPAGIPTAGDAGNEEIPHSDAAATLKELAVTYPDYVGSLVQLRPGSTFELTMADPKGNPISVQVDNKFLTAADGSLLQVGSAGHLPTWATVMEKGLAKWATVFTPASERNTFYGLSNVTANDILRAYAPSAMRDDSGGIVIPGVTPLDPKVATQSAISALNNTFNGLPTDSARQTSFNRAISAALSGDATALKGAIDEFSTAVANAGLKEVPAYDNLITGLNGVLAWVQKA